MFLEIQDFFFNLDMVSYWKRITCALSAGDFMHCNVTHSTNQTAARMHLREKESSEKSYKDLLSSPCTATLSPITSRTCHVMLCWMLISVECKTDSAIIEHPTEVIPCRPAGDGELAHNLLAAVSWEMMMRPISMERHVAVTEWETWEEMSWCVISHVCCLSY